MTAGGVISSGTPFYLRYVRIRPYKKGGKEAVWQMECGESMMGGEIDFI